MMATKLRVKDEIVKDEPFDLHRNPVPCEIINWGDMLDRMAPDGGKEIGAISMYPPAPPPTPVFKKESDMEEMGVMNNIHEMLGLSVPGDNANARTRDGGGDESSFLPHSTDHPVASSGDINRNHGTSQRGEESKKKKKARQSLPPRPPPPPPPRQPSRPLGYNIRIISSEDKADAAYDTASHVATETSILTAAIRVCGRLLQDIFVRAGEPNIGQYMFVACSESHLCQDVIYWWFHDGILFRDLWLSIIQDPRESVAGLPRFAIICYFAILAKYSRKLIKREGAISHSIVDRCVVYEKVAMPEVSNVVTTNEAGLPLLPPEMTAAEMIGIETTAGGGGGEDLHHQHIDPHPYQPLQQQQTQYQLPQSQSVAVAIHVNAIPDPNTTYLSCCTTIIQRCGDNNLFSAAATTVGTAVDLTDDVFYERLFCIINKLIQYQAHTMSSLKIHEGSTWAYQFTDTLPDGSSADRIVNLEAPRDGLFEMFDLSTYILHYRSRRSLPADKGTKMSRHLTILDCLPYCFKSHAMQYIHQLNTDGLAGVQIKKEPKHSGGGGGGTKKRESKPRLAKLVGGGKVSIKQETIPPKESVDGATTATITTTTTTKSAGEDEDEKKSKKRHKVKKEENAMDPLKLKDKKNKKKVTPSKPKTRKVKAEPAPPPVGDFKTPSTTRKRKADALEKSGNKQQPKPKRAKREAGSDNRKKNKIASAAIMTSSSSSFTLDASATTQSPTEYLRSSRGGDYHSPTFPGDDMDTDNNEMFNPLAAPILSADASVGAGGLILPWSPHVPIALPPITSDNSEEQVPSRKSTPVHGGRDLDNSEIGSGDDIDSPEEAGEDDDDSDDDDELEDGGEGDEDEAFKVCRYCSKKYKRAPRHGICGCGITCKAQKKKGKNKSEHIKQPHYQFNESSSVGFHDFLAQALRMNLGDPDFVEACEYITEKGRVKNIAMESCFGCREGPKFCCKCILLGRMDPGHIFIGLMRADNNGNYKVRIAYICSAKCLQLIRAGSGGLNAHSKHHQHHLPPVAKVERADGTMMDVDEIGVKSATAMAGRIVQRYYYPEGRPGNSAKSRDVFHIEHDDLPDAIVKFNMRNARLL